MCDFRVHSLYVALCVFLLFCGVGYVSFCSQSLSVVPFWCLRCVGFVLCVWWQTVINSRVAEDLCINAYISPALLLAVGEQC